MTTVIHASHTRFQESLDLVRQEVHTTTAELEKLRTQRDDYESKVNAQVQELTLMRRALYELESQHVKLRQQYEEEISRLRSQVSHSRAARPGSGKCSPVDMLLAVKSTSDSRDNGRDHVHLERERGAPLLSRVIDPEREFDRLTDIRNPKRQRSRANLDESLTPILSSPKHSSEATSLGMPGIPMGVSPKMQTPSAEYIVPRSIQTPGNDWSVMYNPKAPRLLDVTLLHTLAHGSVVCCVQFSPDGKHVATGSNRSARIYDIKTGQQKCCLIDDTVSGTSADLYIRSVRFSPDGKYLATGAEDRKIRLWDIAKKRICKIFEGHQQEIYSLDFSRDGKLIASGSGDRTARIWDLGGKPPKVFTITDGGAAATASNGINGSSRHHPDEIGGGGGGGNNDGGGGGNMPDSGVTSVAISHDSRLVAAGSLDAIVRVWDIGSGQLLARLQGHTDSVYSVAFSADGRGVISGSLDKCLKYWDISAIIHKLKMQGSNTSSPIVVMQDGPPLERPMSVPSAMNFVGHKDYVLTVAVSVDGNWVVSGSKDRCVHFWDAQNGYLQLSLQGHKNSVISLDLNPTSGLLVTGSGDCQARIWCYSYRPH
ncbi:chromatin associated protein [Amanita muscaria]